MTENPAASPAAERIAFSLILNRLRSAAREASAAKADVMLVSVADLSAAVKELERLRKTAAVNDNGRGKADG